MFTTVFDALSSGHYIKPKTHSRLQSILWALNEEKVMVDLGQGFFLPPRHMVLILDGGTVKAANEAPEELREISPTCILDVLPNYVFDRRKNVILKLESPIHATVVLGTPSDMRKTIYNGGSFRNRNRFLPLATHIFEDKYGKDYVEFYEGQPVVCLSRPNEFSPEIRFYDAAREMAFGKYSLSQGENFDDYKALPLEAYSTITHSISRFLSAFSIHRN